MQKDNVKQFIDSIIKGIGIAAAGGGVVIGSGKLNLTDVDFPTTVMLVVATVVINAIVQYFRKIVLK